MYYDIQERLPLNGVPQYVSIRGERKDAPLLLYLHGGPGDAALPLVLHYNGALEGQFTVAVWEQRGAGKSYCPFGGAEVTIGLFLRDLHALVLLLLERFRQERLILVGHSWGSVLGLEFIRLHPELVRAYVGCGQVVNMEKSCRSAWEFARSRAGGRALARLESIDPSYTGEGWLDDLLFVTGQVVRHGGSLYGRSGYGDLIKPFLFSKYYSLPDLIRRQKGGLQSIRALWPELMGISFERHTRYQVPITLVEGRHDQHVSSALAREYYEALETEKSFFWFEHSCHFPQWSESGAFNRLLPELLL